MNKENSSFKLFFENLNRIHDICSPSESDAIKSHFRNITFTASDLIYGAFISSVIAGALVDLSIIVVPLKAVKWYHVKTGRVAKKV